jgi:hypothetical protein
MKVENKTERTCGYCHIKGHTARTCEEKKKDASKEARKLRRNQAKKYYFEDSKVIKPLLDKLTGEGETALLNNGFMRSAHFIVGAKPETAVSETLIEPLIESLKRNEYKCKVEVNREPHFKTTDNKNKYLDYLVTVSFKGHKQPVKWLIEAEAPNQTHKGIEQIEDFDLEVPNVNGYRYVVTDGYHWHFCSPTIDSQLEWETFKIDDKSFLWGNSITRRLLDIDFKDKLKTLYMLGATVLVLGLATMNKYM